MRSQQSHGGGESVVRNAIHAHFAVVVGDVLHQPVDAVVRVGGLVSRLLIGQIAWRRKDPERALGFESPAQVLEHEDVSVLHQFLERRRHRSQRSDTASWNAVRGAREENRQRTFLVRRPHYRRLQMHAVAGGNHYFLPCEQRIPLRGWLLRSHLVRNSQDQRAGQESSRAHCLSSGVREKLARPGSLASGPCALRCDEDVLVLRVAYGEPLRLITAYDELKALDARIGGDEGDRAVWILARR